MDRMSFRKVVLAVAALAVTCVAAQAATLPFTLATPAAVNFPSTSLGQTSAAQTVTITATRALTIASITIPLTVNSKQEFTVGTVTGCAVGSSIAAGTSCNISVTFTPGYAGPRYQIMSITDSTGSVFTVGLSGYGDGPQALLGPGSVSLLAGASGGVYYSGDNAAIAGARFGFPYGYFVDNSTNIYIGDYSTGNLRVVYQTGSSLACLIQMSNPTLFGLPAGATSCAGATSAPTAGFVYTIAGDQTPYSASVTTHTHSSAGDNGPAGSSFLNAPSGVAVDNYGNIVIADYSALKVRVIYQGGDAMACSIMMQSPTSFGLSASATTCAGATSQPVPGYIYTLAGTGAGGITGDGGKASAALMANVAAVAISPSGDVFVTDNSVQAARTSRIRVIYAGGSAAAALIALENPGTTPVIGNIYRVAGGVFASTGDGGLATSGGLLFSRGIVLDSDQNVIFSDYSTTTGSLTGKVRVIYVGGARMAKLIALENPGTTAVAGRLYTLAGGNGVGYTGDGGLATSAQLGQPYGVTVTPAGDIYVADFSNYAIRKISAANGVITTQVGTGAQGTTTGNALTTAKLWGPWTLVFGSSGTIYFTDPNVYRLRQVGVTPADITFATTTKVGQTSETQYVYHSNVGTQPMTLTSVVASTDFAVVPANSTVSPDCSAALILQPGQTCAVGIVLAPQSVGGTITGTLTIRDNSLNVANNGHSVSLTGTATAKVITTTALTTSASTVDFGKNVTFTATVTYDASTVPVGAGPFGGTVTFTDGTTTLATITPDATGKAVYATTALTAGTHTITATYSGNTDFQTSNAKLTETIIAPAYTATVSTPAVAIVTGQNATITMSVATVGGFSGTITASCGSLPVNITCSFQPASLKFAGADDTQSMQITIGTTAKVAALPSMRSSTVFAGLFGAPLLAFLLRRRKALRGIALAVMAFAILGGISGCGKGQGTAATGTFNVNITVGDGVTTQTQTVTVSVLGSGWKQ